jgi:hypothetical protein
LNVGAPGVLGNDSDFDGPSALSASLVDDVSNGTLDLYADGSFDYTPDSGWSGVDSFTYQAFDGEDYSNIAVVTITVYPAGQLLLDGYCTYFGGGDVDPVYVEVINTDTGVRWDADVVGNYYSLLLSPGEDIVAGETLRLIAKDDEDYVNVTDYPVTQDDIDSEHLQIDLVLDIH